MEGSIVKCGLIELSKQLINKNKTIEIDALLLIRLLLSHYFNKEDKIELDVSCVCWKTEMASAEDDDATCCRITSIWLDGDIIMVEVDFIYYDDILDLYLCDIPLVDYCIILEQLIKHLEKQFLN